MQSTVIVDATLRRTFSNWASAQRPPLRARAALLRAAKQDLAARQHNPSGFAYFEGRGLSLGQVVALDQCLGLYFSLHARVKF